MRRALIRRPLVALVLGLVLSTASAVASPAVAPVAPDALRGILAALDAPVARAAGGIGIRTAARYVVAPKDGVVRVSIDITATNEKPNRNSGGAVTRYFYDGVNLGVQPDARNLRATQDGRAVRVTAADREGYRLVTVFFRDDIFLGERAKVRLQYDLRAGKPRSGSDVRVGPAFASFLAWSFGDGGTIRIDVPRTFEVDVSGAEMRKSTTDGGTQVFRARTADPLSWFAWVNARNDDGLTRTKVTLADGDEVLVRAWPEDGRWRRRVAQLLEEGIPELTTRIGLPWPVDGALSVLEVHTPLLEGYAGFYDPKTDQITISEDLDDVTILHEASHAWFNQRLFTERWITEGLAEAYAAEVVRSIGGGAPGRKAVERDDPAAFPLNDWPAPAPINDEAASDRELYGYAAAFLVISAVLDSAGDEGMQRVFAAADAGTTAYAGDGVSEQSTLPENDWRRFVDLAEELAGADGVAELVQTWALTDDEEALLEGRSSARSAYARLTGAADAWAAPLRVRTAMDGWRFADAEAAIGSAAAILETRDSIEALAGSEALDVPVSLEADYEAAATDDEVRAVAAEVASSEASLRTVAAAADVLAEPRDWLTELGLQGKDPDADLAAARAAWEAGSIDEATSLAGTAAGTLAVAPQAGRGRALVVGGIVGLVLLVAVAVVLAPRRAVRRRVPSSAVGPDDPPL